MSFWGATVITQLLSIIPLIGDRLVIYVWGGFEVSNATLGRFFVLHYLSPFIVLGLVGVHIISMHTVGVSSNTINEFEYFSKNLNLTTLSPYYVVKDYFCFLVTEFFLIYLICYYPERFTFNPIINKL
jgi:ubiquinol-cytochrome c reductase cytochrome b subunit